MTGHGLWVVFLALGTSLALAEGGPTSVPLLRQNAQGVDLKILRVPEGYLFDVGLTPEAAEGLSIKLFRGDRDVTPMAETGRPVAAVIYLFTGIDEARQCQAKWRMDSALGRTPLPSLAFSERPNDVCPELGFAGAIADWPQVMGPQGGYRRILAVAVDETGSEGLAASIEPLLWARRAIPYALTEDRQALATELGGFLQANTSGLLSFLPTPPGDAQPPRMVFYRNGSEFLAVSAPGKARAPAVDLQVLLVSAAALVLLLAAAVMLWRRKRRPATVAEEPVKAVKIGFGDRFDYSLGAGADLAVARLEVFRDGRRRVVRLDSDEQIEIDGIEVGTAAWIGTDAALRIARKRIVFS